jgi:6-pyruvoyltetrahydropterin/6-carboxytetrahydropterin synthase
MVYTAIGKIFRFEAAHQLPNHNGKCRNLHGHSYKLEVEVTGPIKEANGDSDEGMIMDFGDLKKIVQEEIIDLVDHQFLNEVVPPEHQPTTAENMVNWMSHLIWDRLWEDIIELRVRLWETETSYAELVIVVDTEDAGEDIPVRT